MDDFKLKSIDEFDSQFVEEQKKRRASLNKTRESLIPPMAKSPNTDDEPIEIDFFNIDSEPAAAPAKAAQPVPPVRKPAAAPISQQTGGDVPITQLYHADSMSEKTVEPFVYEPQSYDEEDDKPRGKKNHIKQSGDKKVKMNGGALAGKIVAIVLLAATVAVFIFGCFISVFLDNSTRTLGKYTLSTQASDVEVNGAAVSKGDLIIGQKVSPDAYAVGDYVAVLSTTAEGCDIMVVNSVESSSDESCRLELISASNLSGTATTYNSADTLGKVTFYVNSLAGLIGFAMNNAILVCAVFILLAALWCLMLILTEKEQLKKQMIQEDEVQAGSDESNDINS